MNYEHIVLLSSAGSVIVGGQEGTTQSSTQAQDQPQGQQASLFGGTFSMTQWIIIYVVIIAAAYFITAWPQRKREKKVKELQDSIKIGDDVMTTGGFFGKVIDSGDGVYIVEFGTNRGVRIPVSKADVYPAKNVQLDKMEKAEKPDKSIAEKTEN